MDRCDQYWNRLLAEFHCENEEQLAALGIPIQKNELYLSACAAASPETRKRYEEVAARTMLYTHFRFIEYALGNDAFFMLFWAKHYSENCVPDDEFEAIHREILKVGGLDKLPQDNLSLSAKLLSVYGRLGLSLGAEPISRVKALYVSSMNTILDCILYKKAPSVPQRMEPIELKAREKAKGEGYSLALYRSPEYAAYRNKFKLARINKCIHRKADPTVLSDPEKLMALSKMFATTAEQSGLPAGLDDFGDSAAKRYAYLAERLRLSEPCFSELVFALLEAAFAADAAYKNARYEYLQTGLESLLDGIAHSYEGELAEMKNASDAEDLYKLDEIGKAVARNVALAGSRNLDRVNRLRGLLKVHDPKIEELLANCYGSIEKAYAEILNKADTVKAEFTKKQEEKARKAKRKKLFLAIGIPVLLIAVALIVVGVL